MSKPGKVTVKLIGSEIKKADAPTQLSPDESVTASDWIMHPYDMRAMQTIVDSSSILPQCIQAYKSNICGFGIGVKYRDDIDEMPEMAEEFATAERIVELLNTEKDTKEVFEDLIVARETFGIAYLEVIRNMSGEVVQIEFVRDIPSVSKTLPLLPYIETPYFHRGEQVPRRKRYCKYRQELGGKTVYFKEFGDPRIMDNRTGEYVIPGSIELDYEANEILEFPIGNDNYGKVRWIGQIMGIDGSRRAESLNNNYFINGRHTPLMIMVQGGTLSDESFAKLQQYIEGIKGEAGQHAFIVLETEATDARVDFDQANKPTVEIKDLANILQNDELFQNYLENNRKRVQSSFRLPDLYTGYTTDFNRATAQTAMEVTEEQVFQPERKSLAWMINNRLLNGYGFRFCEVYFKEPNISNPDDLSKVLTVANQAGGLTPNKAKDIIFNLLGETSEPYPEEWGDVPLVVQQAQKPEEALGSPTGAETDILPEVPGEEPADQPAPDTAAIDQLLQASLEKQIAKATVNHDDEIVAVLKEVRALLRQGSPLGG